MSLRSCPSCGRHHFAHETRCPFCQAAVAPGADRPSLTKSAALGGLMVLTAVTATACYGAPPLMGLPSDVIASAHASALAAQNSGGC